MPLRFFLPFLALLATLVIVLLGVGEGQDPTHAAGPEDSVLPDASTVPVESMAEDGIDTDGMDRRAYHRSLHAVPSGVRWFLRERRNSEARWQARLDPSVERPLGRWVEVGPNHQAGQTTSVALGSSGTLYLGSAAGGVWKGDRSGQTWTPISEGLGSGVDEILCVPGPGGANGSLGDALLVRRGARVTYSPDGGQTWQVPAGLDSMARGVRMLRQSDGEVLVLAVTRHEKAFKTTLFASQDRGASFAVRYQRPGNWRGDVLARPDGPDGPDLLWIHRKRLLQSLDGGRTWVSRAKLPVIGSTALLTRGGQPAATVYIALQIGHQTGESAWRLFAAEDGDLRLHERSKLPECWRSFVALPKTSGALWTGGLEAHGSLDGGRTFRRPNRWQDYYGQPESALHADVRGLQAMLGPGGAEWLFVHTDGGTYLSENAGISFENITLQGLRVGQVYDTLTREGDQPWLWVGTQDQGLQGGPADFRPGQNAYVDLEPWVSGDYGYLNWISAEGSRPAGVLASYPGFVLWLDSQSKVGQRLSWPEGAQPKWMPPLYGDPQDTQAAYLLAERLYRYARNELGVWEVQAVGDLDLSTEDSDTLVALGAAPGSRTLYLSDDRGGLWQSIDGGATFRRQGTTIAPDHNHYVLARCIWVDRAQTQTLWVAGSGYRGSAVLQSVDGGRTFAPLGEGLPATLVHELAAGADRRMYAATDAGPYVYDPLTERWASLEDASCPNTVYRSVESIENGRILRFGTMGRGVWDFHLP